MKRRRGGSKRPWLAALLGTLATGLGHFYLRRWRRGLGWFLAAVVTSVLFVPADAARALLSGGGDPATLVPMFVVGVASVADAYVLARLQQHEGRTRGGQVEGTENVEVGDPQAGEPQAGGTVASGATADVDAGGASMSDAGTCPNCGKELDAELDFCPWCTTRLDS